MTKYVIFYKQYRLFGRAYVRCIEVVDTDDIYHEIGWLICNSIEQIINVRYSELSEDDMNLHKAFWSNFGYKQLSETHWEYDETVTDV